MEQSPREELDQRWLPAAGAILPLPGGAQALQDDDLARDSGGQVDPRYAYVASPAVRLANTDLAIEPVLGLVRVVRTVPARVENEAAPVHVQVVWRDDRGPCRAAGRYPADQLFPVRVPDPADRLLIRRGIDQATWRRREVSGAVARLIAAYLHLGRRSGLYRFAVMGFIHDRLYDELDLVTAGRPVYRPWASALARHCLGRRDSGPVLGWGPDRADLMVQEQRPSNGDKRPAHKAPGRAAQLPISDRHLSSETARQLIDAAFALGVAATRSAEGLSRARAIIGRRVVGK